MRTLQRIIVPALDVCSEVELYVRLSAAATIDIEDRQIQMRRGGDLRTDTYFGVVSLGTWRDHTTLRRLSLRLDATGTFDVEALVTDLDGADRTVATFELDSHASIAELPPVRELAPGLLWFRVRCTSAEGRVRNLEIVTPDEPARDVHLGVAITTFNRMPYVAANVARLVRMFKENPETAESVSVIIVDNAANLELPVPGWAPIEILTNPNLGGAGGFARGLFEHRRAGRATHVLFMDDDIALEAEVVARTVELLRFAKNDDLCIAGAMLRMDRPAIQFEAGADCDPTVAHLWEARGRGRNLLYREVLLENEVQTPFDYGAWWFYAFPLSITDAYPPPLFVRGDDVFWGLRHMAGRSIAVNGIGVWHADFDHKNGPTSAFYETRNVPIITALAYPQYTAGELRRRVIGTAVRSIMSFRYDWAEATLDGTEAFLAGPDDLMASDPTEVHAGARQRYRSEVLGTLTEDEMKIPAPRTPSVPMSALLRVAAIVTIGGNLLPPVVRRRAPAAIYVQHRSVVAGVFRDELLYRFDPTAEGFTVRRDRGRAFGLLRRTWRVARRISAEFDHVAAAYRRAEPEMTSGAFWQRKFDNPASR